MIIIDPRQGSKCLAKHIPGAILEELDSGDVMIISNTGTYAAIERKTISEMVSSMQGDKRFTGFQLGKMEQEYDHRWLVIDGYHKISDDGLMKFYRRGEEHVNYMSFMNHLVSIAVNRDIILAPQLFWNDKQSAIFIKALANWYSHQDKHTSHTGTYSGRTSLMYKSTRLMKVASQLPGIEHKIAGRVSKHFSSIYSMINAPAESWQEVEGIGKKKSQAIIESIHEDEQ